MIWLSRYAIIAVRNKLSQLMTNPGEVLVVAAPDGFPDVPEVRIAPGMIPSFQYGKLGSDVVYTFWLKCPRDGIIGWDMEGKLGSVSTIEPMHFRDKRAVIPALLVEAYAKHFPFVPARNYFIKDGFVA